MSTSGTDRDTSKHQPPLERRSDENKPKAGLHRSVDWKSSEEDGTALRVVGELPSLTSCLRLPETVARKSQQQQIREAVGLQVGYFSTFLSTAAVGRHVGQDGVLAIDNIFPGHDLKHLPSSRIKAKQDLAEGQAQATH